MFKEFILQNWSLYLVLLAFVIMLKITIFLEHEVIRRMYVLIALIFLLSISVFVEFSLESRAIYPNIRIILMAIRYSATPLIIAQIIYTLVIKEHWTIFLPSVILVIIDFVSIKTGIVFSIAEDGSLKRGLLGYLPFIVAGIYCLLLIYFLVKRSTKLITEIIPIVFLAFWAVLSFPLSLEKNMPGFFAQPSALQCSYIMFFRFFLLPKKMP